MIRSSWATRRAPMGPGAVGGRLIGGTLRPSCKAPRSGAGPNWEGLSLDSPETGGRACLALVRFGPVVPLSGFDDQFDIQMHGRVGGPLHD